MGAWIETTGVHDLSGTDASHPAWVRGLKPATLSITETAPLVAPRVGAWIETEFQMIRFPLRSMSHPAWVRGLKLLSKYMIYLHKLVAPRVGAWIET